MFETAELGRRVPKEAFEAAVPALRVELVDLQQRLRSADFPVLVLFSGVNGAGKGETINLLNEWMDPRWIESSAYQPPSDEERERPRFWRYWRDVPAKGRLGLFLSAWYSRPFLDQVYGHSTTAEYEAQLNECAAFERVLADDGALILKFWMHLGRAQQKRRLKALEKDPLQRWRITEVDWKHWRMYDRFVEVAEHTLRATSIPQAPWKIVEGMDARYRALTVAMTIRDAISAHLGTKPTRGTPLRRRTDPNGTCAVESAADPAAAILDEPLHHTVLTDLDMGLTVGKSEYRKELPRLQGRVNRLFREAKQRGISLMCVFEGWDAGGKGGVVRRLTRALDARDYRVIPIASPNDEEAAHHYLWRFWRQVRRAGRVTIFDRSWYGRVLVERVEGFASPLEWRRAYSEINEFERQLTGFNIVLMKFWLHITPEEQLRRFEERQEIEYKRWKLTDEDWRNRDKWELYERAVQEMVERTSTFEAPWTLVEGNCKRFARLKVLRTVAAGLEGALSAAGSANQKKKKKKKNA
jgi:polyphosphate:AMP phosphotransferase